MVIVFDNVPLCAADRVYSVSLIKIVFGMCRLYLNGIASRDLSILLKIIWLRNTWRREARTSGKQAKQGSNKANPTEQ